ncbi:MAG: hypothetical protein MJ149_01865 [Clostridia bacterium]|nr:hypothetical protein [Clostridia bacterium]
MYKDVFKDSYVLIGPIGAGKSFVADKLSQITGMPVVSLDILKTCPKTITEITQNKQVYISKRSALRAERTHCTNFVKMMSLNNEIAECDKKIKRCNKQVEMREFLPNVRNYYEMFYSEAVASFIKDTYGEVAWSFYQKQFEIKLLSDVVKNLPYACILNIGGTIPICLEEEYKTFAKMFKEVDGKLYNMYFGENQLGFEHIKKILEKFDNVIEFKLPKNYKETMERAGKSKFNTHALRSKQYSQLATFSIDVNGLIYGDNYNEIVAEQIANSIVTHLKKDYFTLG